MHSSEDSTVRRFRSSRAVVRVGSVILALFVLAYVALISSSRLADLHSPGDYAMLVFLWLLAVVALWLLTRAWRATMK